MQHLFYTLAVRPADKRAVDKLSHPLSRLFGEYMSGMAMAAQDLSRPCDFETLCCTPASLLFH